MQGVVILEFGDKLKKIRKEKKLSQEALANMLNTSKQVISRYENNQRSPKITKVIEISEKLNVPFDLLVDKKIEINSDILPIKTQKIPLLGEIACGEPIFADADRESYVEIGTYIKADFCLKAKGDSMINARILDGDIVFIRQQNIVNNGEIAAVIIDDSATLKRVFYNKDEQKLVLSSENPKYSPLVYVGEELEKVNILGKAIAFQSDIV